MKTELIVRWDYGYVAYDIISSNGRYVSRYWFHGNLMYTGFAVGKVKKHWVLCFIGMAPYVFFVPDLYTHPKFPCRFSDYSQVIRFINLLEKEGETSSEKEIKQ